MKIELTKEQYEELLRLVSLGGYVRGAVADIRGEEYDEDRIMEYLLNHAKDFGLESLTEEFHGKLIENDDFSEEVDKMMEDYDEDEFWHGLTIMLGQRDFYRDTPKKELDRIKEGEQGRLPREIQNYYEKYDKEFDEYGIDRLEIKE